MINMRKRIREVFFGPVSHSVFGSAVARERYVQELPRATCARCGVSGACGIHGDIPPGDGDRFRIGEISGLGVPDDFWLRPVPGFIPSAGSMPNCGLDPMRFPVPFRMASNRQDQWLLASPLISRILELDVPGVRLRALAHACQSMVDAGEWSPDHCAVTVGGSHPLGGPDPVLTLRERMIIFTARWLAHHRRHGLLGALFRPLPAPSVSGISLDGVVADTMASMNSDALSRADQSVFMSSGPLGLRGMAGPNGNSMPIYLVLALLREHRPKMRAGFPDRIAPSPGTMYTSLMRVRNILFDGDHASIAAHFSLENDQGVCALDLLRAYTLVYRDRRLLAWLPNLSWDPRPNPRPRAQAPRVHGDWSRVWCSSLPDGLQASSMQLALRRVYRALKKALDVSSAPGVHPSSVDLLVEDLRSALQSCHGAGICVADLHVQHGDLPPMPLVEYVQRLRGVRGVHFAHAQFRPFRFDPHPVFSGMVSMILADPVFCPDMPDRLAPVPVPDPHVIYALNHEESWEWVSLGELQSIRHRSCGRSQDASDRFLDDPDRLVSALRLLGFCKVGGARIIDRPMVAFLEWLVRVSPRLLADRSMEGPSAIGILREFFRDGDFLASRGSEHGHAHDWLAEGFFGFFGD